MVDDKVRNIGVSFPHSFNYQEPLESIDNVPDDNSLNQISFIESMLMALNEDI